MLTTLSACKRKCYIFIVILRFINEKMFYIFLIYLNRTKMYAKTKCTKNASGVQNISKKSNVQNSPASSTDRKCNCLLLLIQSELSTEVLVASEIVRLIPHLAWTSRTFPQMFMNFVASKSRSTLSHRAQVRCCLCRSCAVGNTFSMEPGARFIKCCQYFTFQYIVYYNENMLIKQN